jgi:hypothetical protein
LRIEDCLSEVVSFINYLIFFILRVFKVVLLFLLEFRLCVESFLKRLPLNVELLFIALLSLAADLALLLRISSLLRLE